MKSYSFLFWAYTIVWIGIAAYAGFLGMRFRKVAKRLDRLEEKVRPKGTAT